MNKLIKLAVAFKKSDIRVHQIETQCYAGEITSDQAIELIEKETERMREEVKRITFDPSKTYGYMAQDFN